MNTAKTVEAILNKEDKAVDHILLQNRVMAVKIEELKDSLNAVTNEKNEMEEENDSITKSKNILQGYMKNFHEMNKLEKRLKENHETSYKNYRNMYYVLMIHSLMFYLMIINVNNPMIQFLCFNTFAGVIIGLTFYYHKHVHRVIEQNNKTIMEELAKIHKATDMVTDLMDSL
jgi:hypothetical protein